MERPIFPTTQKEAKKSGKAYSSADNKAAIFPTQLRELREKREYHRKGYQKFLEYLNPLWDFGKMGIHCQMPNR